MGKRFSVLIVTYNHEKYISECISECLEQLGSDDEILVNDDGSSDETLNIINKFKDTRIRVGQTARQGPSSALNRLIRESQGRYLSFISGDDRPTKGRLESQLAFIEKAPAQTFGVSRPHLINQMGQSVPDSKYPSFFENRRLGRQQMYRDLFFNGNFLCAPSWVGRRSEILNLPPFEHLSLQLQDFDYWIKALAKGFEIKISTERWVDYRIPDQPTHLSSEKNIHRMLFELGLIYQSFFDLVDESFLKESFQNDLESKLKSESFNKPLATVYLWLMHSNPMIQRIGMERLYRLYGKPEFQEHFKSNGITEQFFFKKGNEPDFSFLRTIDLIALLGKKIEQRFKFILK